MAVDDDGATVRGVEDEDDDGATEREDDDEEDDEGDVVEVGGDKLLVDEETVCVDLEEVNEGGDVEIEVLTGVDDDEEDKESCCVELETQSTSVSCRYRSTPDATRTSASTTMATNRPSTPHPPVLRC